MIKGIYPQNLQTVEVDILDINGRWFYDHLILVMLAKTIRIFSISPVSRTPGGFHICDGPWLRTEYP
jgi:hypothetical protein